MQVMDGFSRERSKQSATRLSGKGKLLEIKKWVISMMLAARVVKWVNLFCGRLFAAVD
jgi:hypothetical protein